MKKIILLTLAAICLVLGLIGLVLPVIPQIPFLVAAAVLGAAGSTVIKNKIKSMSLYKDHVQTHVLKNKYLREIFDEASDGE